MLVHSSKKVSFLRQKALWSFLTLVGSWVYFFWPTIYGIVEWHNQIWVSLSTYGIALITLYLIISKRKSLANTLCVSSQLGLFAIFLLAIGYIIGDVLGIKYIEQGSVAVMLPAILLTSYGPAIIRVLFFPILYLMLIVPLQDETIPNRSMFVWIAAGSFIAYLWFVHIFQKEEEEIQGKPAWVFQNSKWVLPTIIGFCLMLISPWLADNILTFYPKKQRIITLKAPLGMNGWVGPFTVQSQAWSPVFPNASSNLQVEYFTSALSDRDSVYVYTAYYYADRTFREVLDPINSLYDLSLWKQGDVKTIEVKTGDDETTLIYEIVLRAGAISRLVWYWYYVAGVSTIDVPLANLLDGVRVVAKNPQGSGVVLISTIFNLSPQEGKERLNSFVTSMYGQLDALKHPEITYKSLNQSGK